MSNNNSAPVNKITGKSTRKSVSKKGRGNVRTIPYPLEFKESAVKLALESDGPMSHVARNLGISKATLYNWVYQSPEGQARARNTINPSSKSNSHIKTEEENKRLKVELDKVIQERDLLKKAAAYFARESQ